MKLYPLSTTSFRLVFHTVGSNGPITLAGSPAVALVARVAGATALTSPVSAVTVDNVYTGRHYVTITVNGSALAENTVYDAYLSAGTIDGATAIGRWIGEFEIEADADLEIRTGHDSYWRGVSHWSGVFAGVTSTSVVTLGSNASSSATFYNGWSLIRTRTTLDAARYEMRTIKSYTSGKVATLDKAFSGLPDAGDSYLLMPPTVPYALSLMFASAEILTVDTTGFAGSTTTFQTANTVDESDAYLNQALYNVQTGETVFVTAYNYSTKVRLTVSTMVGTPANGDVFIKLGRRY